MFENVDDTTDGRWTTDARVTGILIAHLGAFGSGELKNQQTTKKHEICGYFLIQTYEAVLWCIHTIWYCTQ